MKLITKNHYDAPSLLDEFFSPYPFGKSYQNGFMRTDISKRKGNYVFDIDIPGYQKDDIKVQLNDGYLTVWVGSDKNTKSCDSQDCEWLHQERFNGEYSRSFYVGCSNDAKANATYHNGVLTVVIPEEDTTYKDSTKYINVE